jgi:hypothetical protein
MFSGAGFLRPARRLHVGGAPRLRADRAQEGAGVEGAGADFHIVWLEQGAALLVPVGLQGQDNLLKCQHLVWSVARNSVALNGARLQFR